MHSTSKFLLIDPITRCINCSKGIYSFTISRDNSATLQLERADYILIKYTIHSLQPGRLLYMNKLRQRDIWLGLHVLVVLYHFNCRCTGFLSDNVSSVRSVLLVTRHFRVNNHRVVRKNMQFRSSSSDVPRVNTYIGNKAFSATELALWSVFPFPV